jgi:hypothetical protein
MLLPLLAAPALVAQASPEWDKAVSQLKQNLAKRPGFGVTVMLERLDAQTVRIRLQLIGASVKEANFYGRTAEGIGHAALQLATPKGIESLNTTAMLSEHANLMEVGLKGEDFSPSLRLRVPKQGEKPEVAMLSVETAAR